MRLLGWILLAAFTVEFWWLLLAVVVVVVVVVLARRAARAAEERRRAAAAERAALAARADQQHAWTLAGDPRGTYGRYPPASSEHPARGGGP